MDVRGEAAHVPPELEFNAKPVMLPVYFRVVTKAKNRLKAGQDLPLMSAVWHGAGESRSMLAAYREACGLPQTGTIPVLYPYLLAARLHMAIMADSRFPITPMGAVHARNTVLQHRAIGEGEKFELESRLAGQRVIKAGLEIRMDTTAERDGTVLWECSSAYLVRGNHFGRADGPLSTLTALQELEQPNGEAAWEVPKNIGRRYARISGDYNPIHVSRTLSRLFGFPARLAHGMWSLARCIAQLPVHDAAHPIRVDAAFKGPVFLGSRVCMKTRSDGESHRFDLFCAGNPRPVLAGALRPASEGESLLD